jgi:hypothetical protein
MRTHLGISIPYATVPNRGQKNNRVLRVDEKRVASRRLPLHPIPLRHLLRSLSRRSRCPILRLLPGVVSSSGSCTSLAFIMMFLPFSHSVDPHQRDPSPRTSDHVFQDKPSMMNRASTGVLHFIGSDGLENEGDGFKERRSGALHGVRSAFEIACVCQFMKCRIRPSRRGL